MIEPIAVMEKLQCHRQTNGQQPAAPLQFQSAFSLLKPHDLEFFVQVKQAEQSGDTL